MLESTFQRKITKRFDDWIKEGRKLYYFVKTAGSVRGIPDLVICANGTFVVWEVKPTEEEAAKTTGRIALQKYTITRVERANGQGAVVHPGNIEAAMRALESVI